MRSLKTTAVVFLLTACGAAAERAGEEQQMWVDTVGSTVHVRNAGAAAAWRAEQVLRLGSVEGGPEEFGRIRSLLADGDGNVYVADNLAQEIRVFSPEGRHLRTIGRRGSGPGEFASLYSLAWLGGNLAAMDPGNGRIGILSPEGEWLDGIQHFPITGPPADVRLHPLGVEAFYARVIDPQRQSLPYVRYTSAGPRDTIDAPAPPGSAARFGVVCEIPGGISGIAIPQAPALAFAFPPEGGAVAVAWTDSYRVSVLEAGGDTLRTITHERPLLSYPDELWEDAIRPYRELMENHPGARCDPGAPERPRNRSALRHMMFDEEGRLWVEAASEDGFTWEIFDTGGRLVGAAPAPPRAERIPPYARNGHLYQVERDEMDVQYVAVYRVIP